MVYQNNGRIIPHHVDEGIVQNFFLDILFPKDLNSFLKIIGKGIKIVSTPEDSTFSSSSGRKKYHRYTAGEVPSPGKGSKQKLIFLCRNHI